MCINLLLAIITEVCHETSGIAIAGAHESIYGHIDDVMITQYHSVVREVKL